jgi:hypothetical protein
MGWYISDFNPIFISIPIKICATSVHVFKRHNMPLKSVKKTSHLHNWVIWNGKREGCIHQVKSMARCPAEAFIHRTRQK